MTVCTVMSVALFGLFGMAWWKYRAFDNKVQKLSIFGSSTGGGTTTQTKHDIDGKDQNILVVGNDDRSTASASELRQLGTTADGGSLNTDTMMIIHVPANGTKATLISLPRDSWVNIPGYGYSKLNSAYPDGYSAAGGSASAKRAAGAKLLVKTVQGFTGLTMDHFVSVDLLGFYRISNAIGGIPVNMCGAVQDSFSGVNLHKGANTIKGAQALAFVRQRHGLTNGDLDRVRRQQYFLTAAFRKVTSAGVLLNPFKLQHLLNAVSKSLYIDASLDPLALARQLENLTANNITGKTIPTTFGTSSDGQDILVVDPATVKTFVNQVINGTTGGLSGAKTVAPATVTVDVLNGGTVNGAASTNAAELKHLGFKVGTVDQGTASANTVIQYSSGMESQAKTLLAYVPGATTEKVSGLARVTLLLGADGLSVKAKTPTPHPTTTAPKPKPIDASCIN